MRCVWGCLRRAKSPTPRDWRRLRQRSDHQNLRQKLCDTIGSWTDSQPQRSLHFQALPGEGGPARGNTEVSGQAPLNTVGRRGGIPDTGTQEQVSPAEEGKTAPRIDVPALCAPVDLDLGKFLGQLQQRHCRPGLRPPRDFQELCWRADRQLSAVSSSHRQSEGDHDQGRNSQEWSATPGGPQSGVYCNNCIQGLWESDGHLVPAQLSKLPPKLPTWHLHLPRYLQGKVRFRSVRVWVQQAVSEVPSHRAMSHGVQLWGAPRPGFCRHGRRRDRRQGGGQDLLQPADAKFSILDTKVRSTMRVVADRYPPVIQENCNNNQRHFDLH